MKEQVPTTLTANLIRSYERTHYHVSSEKPFTLILNKKSNRLRELFSNLRASCATYITAFNPLSCPLSYEENQSRNENLKSDIADMGLILISGFGQDPLGKWSKEESFLIFGLNLPDAKTLGVKYQQNAILWCDIDAIPKLILLK